jgi:hypothetical protein
MYSGLLPLADLQVMNDADFGVLIERFFGVRDDDDAVFFCDRPLPFEFLPLTSNMTQREQQKNY